MHELSIAGSMLDMIAEQVGGAKPLERVAVRIGTLSGVCPDALAFVFPEAAETMGFGCPTLDIKIVPAQATCSQCATKYEMEDAFQLCPACQSMDRVIEGGDECMLDSVELEGEADE